MRTVKSSEPEITLSPSDENLVLHTALYMQTKPENIEDG